MTTVLAVLSMLGTLVPVIIDLMKTVEKEMGAGTGKDKKEKVLDGVRTIIGDETVWAKLQTLFSGIINFLAMMHFGSKAA